MIPFPHDTISDAARILERITDAFFALDTEWRFTYINSQAEVLWERSRADLLGRNVWDEFPEAVDSTFDRQFRRALSEGVAVSFEEFYPPLDAWLDIRAYPSQDGLSVFFQNVTERRRTQDALREREQRLRAAQTRLDVALTAGDIATWTWDLVNQRIIADDRLARLFSLSPENAASGGLDVYFQAIHPDDRRRLAQIIAEALAGGEIYEAEYRIALADGGYRWLAARGRVERDAEGKAAALPGVVLDITERVERERRERFLAELADRTRRLTDPEEVIAVALQSVGEFLGVARCVFVDIDIEADTCICHPDYRADDLVASMAGVFSISAFGAVVVAAYGAGQAVAVDDVHNDPAQVPPETVAAYDAVGIRAHIGVPVVHSARLVSCIGAHSAMPRRWKPEEVELLQTVVERTWLTVEVTRQERALGREAETTARILDTITDGFYAIDREWRFRYINAQAERMLFRTREELLGQGIWDKFPEAVGGTFYHLYRRAMQEGVSVSVEDYYAPLDSWMDVRVYPSADGLSVFFQNVNERKRSERALRESEERLRFATEGAGVGVWKLVPATNELTWSVRCAEIFGLPTDDGFDPSGALAWSMIPPEDVLGIQAALERAARENTPFHYEYPVITPGGETRWVQSRGTPYYDEADQAVRDEADQAVRVEGILMDFTRQHEAAQRLAAAYEKERNIAQQLQSALTPAVPERVPGLAVTKHYEAALAEAGVGGDFYDIFPIDKGCTALVVGDLSGKGLAAASQVATVRNMLRYAVLRGAAIAEAVTDLNDVLAEQGLLTGFATLFLGTYDSSAGRLTYVNCGQEPALVRRAGTGGVEPLPPTGPVLGSFAGAAFEEQTVTLRPGDSLAVFTDGLTEVGRSRREMLGLEGVTGLLAGAVIPAEVDSAEAVAEQMARHLIAGVNAAAQGGVMRDDMCLLVAVAK